VWVKVRRSDDLIWLVTLAATNDWPLTLVGNGSNSLFADQGVRGIVAQMADEQWRLEANAGANDQGQPLTRLIAGAGVSLPQIGGELQKRGLSGLEWGAGVPGTIGGAVVSNAGAHQGCIGDTLESARILIAPAQPGQAPTIQDFPADALGLGYRTSRFRAGRLIGFDDEERPLIAPRALIEPAEIILSATFLLSPDSPERIQQRIDEYKAHRKVTQPTQASAGSVFKNPQNEHAGSLIDRAKLKGTRIGNAEISQLHGNFIVTSRGARAADVAGLIALARRTVRERFGVELELEVELRGDW